MHVYMYLVIWFCLSDVRDARERKEPLKSLGRGVWRGNAYMFTSMPCREIAPQTRSRIIFFYCRLGKWIENDGMRVPGLSGNNSNSSSTAKPTQTRPSLPALVECPIYLYMLTMHTNRGFMGRHLNSTFAQQSVRRTA